MKAAKGRVVRPETETSPDRHRRLQLDELQRLALAPRQWELFED